MVRLPSAAKDNKMHYDTVGEGIMALATSWCSLDYTFEQVYVGLMGGLPLCLQGDKFSAKVAALEAEVKLLKAANAKLAEDNKTCYNTIRAKDKELDAAAKVKQQAERTAVENKVCRRAAARFRVIF